MMKPPINRMGGKSRLRKEIIGMMPSHICYVEPFFGAGWVYWGKEISEVEVINDKDQELINLFRIIKEHPEELERILMYEFISRDRFYFYKDINIENLTDIQRAARYLYIASNSFASRGGTFGYGALKKPSQKIFLEDFKILRDRLKNTYVENKDALDIINRYDRENTFFFCDPPYYDTAGYKEKFTKEDHIKLRDALSSISGKFLLTINDHEEIRELYKDFNLKETKVTYSVSKKREARREYGELIITNY